jgi:hypothetical protein
MTQYEYKVRRIEHTHIAEVLDEMGAKGWRFREVVPASSFDVRLIFEREIQHLIPTAISFKESTMNQTQAGQSQVFTGTLSPAGATMPPDATFTIASNDPSVSPSVDSTGLIVSVTYPTGWGRAPRLRWHSRTPQAVRAQICRWLRPSHRRRPRLCPQASRSRRRPNETR